MVNKLTTASIVLALALVGCDLEEAERMDLTRSGVSAIDPSFREVRFRGSSTIPLRVLMTAIQRDSAGIGWSFEWEDLGTSREDTALLSVRAVLEGEIVFEYTSPGSFWGHSFSLNKPIGEWLDKSEIVTFQMFKVDRTYGTMVPLEYDPKLRIVDDRPGLEYDASPNAKPSVRKGDTVTIGVRNPNSELLAVFSDHSGLRMLGDYVTELSPGASAKLRWVVTANPGKDVWIDLGWGEWGGTKRFQYQLEQP